MFRRAQALAAISNDDVASGTLFSQTYAFPVNSECVFNQIVMWTQAVVMSNAMWLSFFHFSEMTHLYIPVAEDHKTRLQPFPGRPDCKRGSGLEPRDEFIALDLDTFIRRVYFDLLPV